MSIQFLVILVPVVLGMMGFAIDLGRIYLIRGELNQAASAMALAAAARLNGTTGAPDVADAAARVTLDNTLTDGNKYNFGSLIVGDSSGLLSGTITAPAYFAGAAEAVTALGQTSIASTADGTTARHATINLTATAPLLFWGLLSLGQSRTTLIAASAVAGVSAPVCTACGVEPFAVTVTSTTDVLDFGLTKGSLYTLGMQCNGAPAGPAAALAGTAGRFTYNIIDRYDTSAAFTEFQQLYRSGAQGLAPSANQTLACARIGSVETTWATVVPRACAIAAARTDSVPYALCGVSTRLSDAAPAACQAANELTTLAPAYTQDPDSTYVADYPTYQGNNRRLMTLPIVDSTLTVLGFRQFLLEPNDVAGTLNNPTDADGRFVVQYLGVVAPVKQGRMDGSCGVTTGPGKVVLHQ